MDELLQRLPWWGYCMQGAFAVSLVFIGVVWLIDIVARWREAKWSTKRFTPEQYEDFVRRAAQQGARYMQRNGGRIHFLDMMQEGLYGDDPKQFDQEHRRRLGSPPNGEDYSAIR
jgi:hypothetical protein